MAHGFAATCDLFKLISKTLHGYRIHAGRITHRNVTMGKAEQAEIEELYVVVGHDSNGAEGIAIGFDEATGGMEPLLGSRRRLPRILELAKALANESGKTLSLVKFSSRGMVETIQPEGA